MRQAGRSLPEYRALREKHSMLDLCTDPDLAVEVSLQPVRRLGVDAAILFSDIVVPLRGMGIDLDIREGVGPVITSPIRTPEQAEALQTLEPGLNVPFVLETVRRLTDELDVPVIGFAGAPFTLASYLIEGGPSRNHERTKTMMRQQPELWSALMDVLAESMAAYLRAQIEAGASAVQLFDSWVGALAPAEFRAHVLPWVRRIMSSLEDAGAARIYFGIQTGELLADMAASGADAIGVDWRVPLDEARRRTSGATLQGNLDPTACLASWEVVEPLARDVLDRGGGRAHVFNLGHGVLPGTDPDILKRLVDFVHEWTPDE